MHDLRRPRRRIAPAFRGDGAGAATDEDDEVSRIYDRAGFHHAAIRADDADRQRIPLADRALAANRGGNRRTQRLSQLQQHRLGPGDHHAAAADEQRLLRRQDQLGGLLHILRVRPVAARGVGTHLRIGPHVAFVHRALLHIEGQAQMRRTRLAGGHLLEGGAQRTRDILGPVDDGVVLRERAEQRVLVQLGQGVTAARGNRDIRGHRQDRDRAFIGFHHARQDVGGAAAARPLADADLAGGAGIAVRHVGGRALVARQDVLDAMVEAVEGIIERQAGVAAQAEHDLHLVMLQHAHESIGAG